MPDVPDEVWEQIDVEMAEDEAREWDPDARQCEGCGDELDLNDETECRRCTGLDRCSDDMCHGAGRCLHGD